MRRFRLKIAKKCCLYLDILTFGKSMFFAEMHVRCDNQYKTGADGGNILGQPMLFNFMGICLLSPAHESEMRGYLVHLLFEKYSSIKKQKSATVYLSLIHI